jgi:hypothetical protein
MSTAPAAATKPCRTETMWIIGSPAICIIRMVITATIMGRWLLLEPAERTRQCPYRVQFQRERVNRERIGSPFGSDPASDLGGFSRQAAVSSNVSSGADSVEHCCPDLGPLSGSKQPPKFGAPIQTGTSKLD